MMGQQQEDQDDSEFNFSDIYDHTDDDWINFYDQNITFQYFQFDFKDEPNRNESNANDNTDSHDLKMNETQVKSVQFQKQNFDQPKKPKRHKTKVILTPAAEQFRKRLYKLLTNGEKKVVRKEFVFFFHSLIREKYPNIRDVRRDEYRSIGNYFNAFSNQQNFILQAIREQKEIRRQENLIF